MFPFADSRDAETTSACQPIAPESTLQVCDALVVVHYCIQWLHCPDYCPQQAVLDAIVAFPVISGKRT